MKLYIFIIICCVSLFICLSVVSASKKGKGKEKGKGKGKGREEGCERRINYLPTPDKTCVAKMCKPDNIRCVPEFERIFVFLKPPITGGFGSSTDFHLDPWPQSWHDYNAIIGFKSPDSIRQAGRKAIEYFETFFGLKAIMDLQAAVTDAQLINGEILQFPDFTFNAVLDAHFTIYIETKEREVKYYENPPPVYLGDWCIQFKKDIYLNGTGFQGWARKDNIIEWGHYLIESGKYCGFDDTVVIHFEAREPIILEKIDYPAFTMTHEIYGEGLAIGQFARPFRDTNTVHSGVLIKFPALPQNCA